MCWFYKQFVIFIELTKNSVDKVGKSFFSRDDVDNWAKHFVKLRLGSRERLQSSREQSEYKSAVSWSGKPKRRPTASPSRINTTSAAAFITMVSRLYFVNLARFRSNQLLGSMQFEINLFHRKIIIYVTKSLN